MTIKKITPKQIDIIRDELEEILTEPLKNLGLSSITLDYLCWMLSQKMKSF